MNLFIDTETTGLPRGRVQPRIVSIAWIVADAPTQQRSLKSVIVKPHGFLIPDEASAFHGITTDRARREGIALDAALGQLALDVKHLQAAAGRGAQPRFRPADRRGGIPASRPGCALGGSTASAPSRSRASVDRTSRRSSATCIGGCSVRPLEGAHDARNDVAACMRIFFALHDRPPTGSNDDEEARHAGVLIERVLDWGG